MNYTVNTYNGLGCLTSLSTLLFQLYRGGQFYW